MKKLWEAVQVLAIIAFVLITFVGVVGLMGLPLWLGLWLYYAHGNTAEPPPPWMLWIDGAWGLMLVVGFVYWARRVRAESRAMEREARRNANPSAS
jgi:hypothetical protein